MGRRKKSNVQSHASMFWRKGLDKANIAPRCHAMRKRDGHRCQQAAMKGKRVCRMHGGTAGAPKGNKNRYIHGRYTADAKNERKDVSAIIRELKILI